MENKTIKEMFKGFYQLSEEDFSEIWEHGTFVFDTNVLLNLYRYKNETSTAIIEIIKNLGDRVWVPHHVLLEFHRNRLEVIADQNKKVNDIKKSIEDSIKGIENKSSELQLEKRHNEIDPQNFLSKFRELEKTVLDELEKVTLRQLNNSFDDNILCNITEIFEGKVGCPPEHQDWLDAIFKDGDERAENEIPPSFKDIQKAKKSNAKSIPYTHNLLKYQHGYGDLIIWMQIIEHAKKENKKNIVFITDDKKEDWMQIISSNGSKVIGPRPELVSEICNKANVEKFHIYNTESFLKFAEKYLQTEIKEAAIKDVKNTYYEINSFEKNKYFDLIEENIKVRDSTLVNQFNLPKELFYSISDRGSDIIEEWLENKYSYIKKGSNGLYDFYGFDPNDSIIPVIIKFSTGVRLRDLPLILERLMLDYKNGNKFKKYHIVLVMNYFMNDSIGVDAIYSMIKKDIRKYNENFEDYLFHFDIDITVGFIDKESKKFETMIDYEFGI